MGKIPFTERKTLWRGVLDLTTGCYPKFVLGGRVGRLLPVFHFHDVSSAYLEPYLAYLAENGYQAIIADDIARWVRGEILPQKKTVALCFDDAWRSLWTVAFPCLQKYKLRAIAFVAPALIEDAPAPRAFEEATGPALTTWPELRALHASGIVDIQAHTLTHSMIFCDDRPIGFVTPDYAPLPLTAPLMNKGLPPVFLSATELGTPLYLTRARCSDARRFFPDPETVQACRRHVMENGGADFFRQPGWQRQLLSIARHSRGQWEPAAETAQAIFREVREAREILNAQLATDTVRHICFPWAVAGHLAEDAARCSGYLTAFADQLFGRRAVAAGDNPYRLMRLKHQFIFALPGRQRRFFLGCRYAKPCKSMAKNDITP